MRIAAITCCGLPSDSAYRSLYDMMRELLPQLDWDRIDTRREIRAEEILARADAHHARHGTWPQDTSGEIPGTGRTWNGVACRLRRGLHGLPGGISLAKFLEKYRGVRVGRKPPQLSEEQILAWADAWFADHGKWPARRSGNIPGTRETWSSVDCALRTAGRGIRRASSLAELLARRRGVRNRMRLPPLTEQQILTWTRTHFETTGQRPSQSSGPVGQSPGDTWSAVDKALAVGHRGLPGGSSLTKLLRAHGLK
jgi:hypothetical protein